MNTTVEHPPRKRTDGWLAAVVIAFVLGFLLAWWLWRQQPNEKTVCPQPGTSHSTPAQQARAGGGAMHGGGAPGKGSPAAVNGGGRGNSGVAGNGAPGDSGDGTPAGGGGNGSGQVKGGGSFDVNGKTVVNGASGKSGDAGAPSQQPSAEGGGNGDLELPPVKGSAAGDVVANVTPSNGKGGTPGDGDMDGGGNGRGEPPQGESQPTPPSSISVTAPAGTQPVARGPGGALQPGAPMDDSGLGANKPAEKVVAALDYRYDKSGLPHYPNAIKVASGTDAAMAAAAAGPSSKNFSVTEIITDDAPDVAAAWYHDHLPSGWNEQSMPSPDVMNQAIAQAKAPANGDPVSAMLNALVVGPQLQQSKPGIDAARAAGLTIFQPADPNSDHRMIIVIRDSKTGKTGVLLMKKADTQ